MNFTTKWNLKHQETEIWDVEKSKFVIEREREIKAGSSSQLYFDSTSQPMKKKWAITK